MEGEAGGASVSEFFQIRIQNSNKKKLGGGGDGGVSWGGGGGRLE